MAETSILARIVARRRRDVQESMREVPLRLLEERARAAPPPLSFVERLGAAAPMAVIGEIKRASPSRGEIDPAADAAALAAAYASAGASGISVLTEPTWFKGSLADLEVVSESCRKLGPQRPAVLRKDFIVHEYQVVESRAAGADSLLLIVAALTQPLLEELLARCRGSGMEPLVEVNTPRELERALSAGAKLVGINNRDLRTFAVDLATTERLAFGVPEGVFLVALSGIKSRQDVERFAAAGARAVLVGEALMLARDPERKLRELLGPGVVS